MNGASPVRIFLADDHVILRTGVRKLIEDEPDLVVVGEASDGGVPSMASVASAALVEWMSWSWISPCQTSMAWKH